MKYPHAVLKDWIERCIEEGRNLTPWETGFLTDINDQFSRSGTLSEKQIDSLERIYVNKV